MGTALNSRPHSLGKRHAVAVRHVDVADDQSNLVSKFLDDPKAVGTVSSIDGLEFSRCRMALMNFRTEGSSSRTSEMRPMPLWTASRYEKVPNDCRFGKFCCGRRPRKYLGPSPH